MTSWLLDGTCASASDCWAVGYWVAYGNGYLRTLIERWQGTSWAIVTSPNVNNSEGQELNGVTCVTAADCWAVGYYATRSAPGVPFVEHTLVERWNGISWAIVTSPSSSAAQNNILFATTCITASDCWAVGRSSVNDQTYQTLVERWDGTSWAIVTSPNRSAVSNSLFGVSCTSATNCWAVGWDQARFPETLVERWDGTSWAIVFSPGSSTSQRSYLFGVTCPSVSDCWAVGMSGSNGLLQTLVERWDGTTWSIVTSPNTAASQSTLWSATCA